MPRYSYGWKRSLGDIRDYRYRAPEHVLKALPPSVDLTPQCPPVLDQQSLGACTAHALASALQFDQIKQGETPLFVPSRLFIYYCERDMEGTVNSDSGAELRDGMKCVNQQGACSEQIWPYDIEQFAVKPPDAAYQAAAQHKAITYQAVDQDLDQMRGCLADGYPFVAGISVYESFESEEVAQTGVVPDPSPTESLLGGHAILIIGYSNETQRFLAQNSWGNWGLPTNPGRFTISFSYLSNPQLAADFWTIRTIS